MGLGQTNSKCDPNRDYSYIEILETAAIIDCCMMEDFARNGSLETKRNLVKVLSFWGNNHDGIWDIKQGCIDVLLKQVCPHCDNDWGTLNPEEWICGECNTEIPVKQLCVFEPNYKEVIAPTPTEKSIRRVSEKSLREFYHGMSQSVDSEVPREKEFDKFEVKIKEVWGSGTETEGVGFPERVVTGYRVTGKLHAKNAEEKTRTAKTPDGTVTIPVRNAGWASVYSRKCPTKEIADQTATILKEVLKEKIS